MSKNIVELPYKYYPDPTKGKPVYLGYIYIGEPNTDPEVVINQKQVTMSESCTCSDGSTPIAQPIRTGAGGVPEFNGSSIALFTEGNYSIKVLNSKGDQVYYSGNVRDGEPLTLNNTEIVLNFSTLSEAVSADYATAGAAANLKERTTGNGGGAMWDYVLASSVTTNTFDVVACTGDTSLALVLRVVGSVLASTFGASPNSTADTNRDAIQAAIDFASSENRGLVVISSGVHLISNTAYVGASGAGVQSLILRDNVWLEGVSLSSVIKLQDNAYGAGAYGRIITSLGDSGAEDGLINSGVRNLTVDGNKDNQIASTQYTNILLEAKGEVSVIGCRSINCQGNGVMVRGQVAAIAKNIRITDNTVKGVTGIGIQAAQFDGCQILANNVDDCVNNAIDIYGNKSGDTLSTTSLWVISGNVCSNSLNGIFPETVRDGVVSNNSISFCNYGIHINRINGDPRNVNVINNEIHDCTTAGLWASGDNSYTRWANNSVAKSPVGIKVGGGGQTGGCVAYGNFFDTCDEAIVIDATGANNIKVFNNYGLNITTWKTVPVGLASSVFVEDDIDITASSAPYDWVNSDAFSTSNTNSRSAYFRNSGGILAEFGRMEWKSTNISGGNIQSSLSFITKEANNESTPLVLLGDDVQMVTLPLSDSGIVVGTLWNNAGVVSVKI